MAKVNASSGSSRSGEGTVTAETGVTRVSMVIIKLCTGNANLGTAIPDA